MQLISKAASYVPKRLHCIEHVNLLECFKIYVKFSAFADNFLHTSNIYPNARKL